MGLFGKIAAALAGKSGEDRALASELETLKREGRMHSRHVVHNPALVTVKLSSGIVGKVLDVSYSGLGAIFPAGSKDQMSLNMPPITMHLTILDREITIKAAPVHWTERSGEGTFVGIRIQHEAAATLMAVKELIEPLAWGGSLQPIGADIRNDRYKGDDWICFRGEDPTDILLRMTPDKKDVAEALMTFRLGSAYLEVVYREGILTTGQSEGTAMYGGAQMATSADGIDAKIARYAVCILLSAPANARDASRPLLKRLLGALKIDLVDGT